MAQRGITFARANLGHNLTDHAPDDTMFGADSGDFFAVPDPNAYLPYPLMPATGRAMCWMRQEGGDPWDGCPRTALKRQIDAFAALGIGCKRHSSRKATCFSWSRMASPPGRHARHVSVAALETQAELFHRISETLQAMGIEIEQIAPEWGPGQFEVNLRYAPPLRAADNLVALKDVVRALARQAGLTASFMPKPRETLGGCGLHVHLSLWNDRGESLTEGADHPSGLSETAASFWPASSPTRGRSSASAADGQSSNGCCRGHGRRRMPPTRSAIARRWCGFRGERGGGSNFAPATT